MVGLLPTTTTVGVVAPIALVGLRIGQGLAVGGERAGVLCLASESAPARHRGSYALFPRLGPSFGSMLSTATFLCVLPIPETRGTALGDTDCDRAPSTNDRTPEETNADR